MLGISPNDLRLSFPQLHPRVSDPIFTPMNIRPRHLLSLPLLALSFGFTCSVFAANANPTIVFSDDFTGRSEIGEDYVSHKEWVGDWTVVDGVLVGKQLNPGHGATIRMLREFRNLDIEFDFRFNGGTRWNFVVDDHNYQPVHAGHICRLSLSPNSIKVADDKTGAMDLNIRNQRQDENLPAAQREELDAYLETKQAHAKLDLKAGQWYKLRVVIQDDMMSAYIDGKLVTSHRSPGFAHPTKTKFGFTVNGSSTEFDNLKIFATKP